MGCANERKSPVPEEKQKLSTKSSTEKSTSATGKYFCVECLEDSLLGKRKRNLLQFVEVILQVLQHIKLDGTKYQSLKHAP